MTASIAALGDRGAHLLVAAERAAEEAVDGEAELVGDEAPGRARREQVVLGERAAVEPRPREQVGLAVVVRDQRDALPHSDRLLTRHEAPLSGGSLVQSRSTDRSPRRAPLRSGAGRSRRARESAQHLPSARQAGGLPLYFGTVTLIACSKPAVPRSFAALVTSPWVTCTTKVMCPELRFAGIW